MREGRPIVVRLLQKNVRAGQRTLCCLLCLVGLVSCSRSSLPEATGLEKRLKLSEEQRKTLQRFRKHEYPLTENVFWDTFEILQYIRNGNLNGQLPALSKEDIHKLCGPFDIEREDGSFGYTLEDPESTAPVLTVIWIIIEDSTFKAAQQGGTVGDPDSFKKLLRE